MAVVALTFTDDQGHVNPYSPVTEFQEWYAWDPTRAAVACSLLARETVIPPDASLDFQEWENERAVDLLVAENIPGYLKKYTLPTQE